MFVLLGSVGVIPALHYINQVGYNKFIAGSGGWLIGMAILYIIGATVYSARIPERLFPGRFDIWVSLEGIYVYIYAI